MIILKGRGRGIGKRDTNRVQFPEERLAQKKKKSKERIQASGR
jgi:hypothetical protein